MTRYATVAPGEAITTRVVQSSTPDDLASRVNAALGGLGGLVVTAITLAGAGDGHTFTVTIEAAETVSSGGLTSAAAAAFAASDAQALQNARAGAAVAAPVVDLQVAGASTGQRFMGLLVGGVLGAEEGGEVVFESIAVAGTSRLDAFNAASTPDGSAAFVLTVRDEFRLERDAPSLTPDGITIVQALNVADGRWVRRRNVGDEFWRRQNEWHIDAATGDDENDGSAGAPLATWAELARRYGANPRIEQTTNVFIESDLPETLFFIGACVLRAGIRYLINGGVKSVLDSGTLTNVTAQDAPTQQPFSIEAPGLDAFTNARIRFTTGAAAGGVCWSFRSPAADQLDCVGALTYNFPALPSRGTPVTPAIGDDYVVESLWEVEGFDLEFVWESGDPFISAAGIDSLAQSDSTEGINLRNVRIVRSELQGGKVRRGSDLFATACFFNTSLHSAHRAVYEGTLLRSPFGQLFFADGNDVGFANHTICVGSPMRCFESMIVVQDGVAVFDSVADGIELQDSTRMRVDEDSLVWGDGNAAFGLFVRSGALVSYFEKPIITGATNDTRIGGVPTAYGGVPTFNTTSGCGIVESQ